MLRFNRAGRVVRFAPFNANAREALAARLGLLPFLCCPLLAQSGHSVAANVRFRGKSGPRKSKLLVERSRIRPASAALLLALVVVAADGYRCHSCTHARYAKLLKGR